MTFPVTLGCLAGSEQRYLDLKVDFSADPVERVLAAEESHQEALQGGRRGWGPSGSQHRRRRPRQRTCQLWPRPCKRLACSRPWRAPVRTGTWCRCPGRMCSTGATLGEAGGSTRQGRGGGHRARQVGGRRGEGLRPGDQPSHLHSTPFPPAPRNTLLCRSPWGEALPAEARPNAASCSRLAGRAGQGGRRHWCRD